MRKGREFAMQLLYAIEVGKEPFASALASLPTEPGLDEEQKAYGVRLARTVLGNLPELDAAIDKAASNWDLERIAVVDKLVIRMAAAELMFDPGIPTKVAINEAIDIAKKFSTGESSRFVNGVLDSIARQSTNPIQRNPPDA